ncbi:MAG: putative lipid II flippase FtsW [Maricaulaceae bacterium]
MIGRAGGGAAGVERSAPQGALSRWWWSVDRVALGAVLALIAVGIVLSLAASPSAAARRDVPEPFFFLYRHSVFALIGVGVILAGSALSLRDARRLGVLSLLGGLALMGIVFLVGHEVNGAQRWLRLPGFSLQPSEFAKAGLVVTSAWLFTSRREDPNAIGSAPAFLFYGLMIALLILQPDFGQAVLVTALFGAVFFFAGMSWGWIAGLGVLAGVGAGFAYALLPHVQSRVDRFLDPSSGDTYQIDRALEAIAAGGLFGVGPGEGEVKHRLPDAHTDFVFAVAAEEFGVLFCCGVIALYAVVVGRGFARARRLIDPFSQLAGAGLAGLIGLQAVINIAVNLSLAPPKGMTLPFISYGGSSMLAMCFAAGLMLNFTRRRPGAFRSAQG